jgi:hypothetical protein
MSESTTHQSSEHESAYERGARHQREGATPGADGGSGGGKMGFLTRQLGPFPIWVWGGLGLALAFMYFMWAKNNQKSSTPSQTAAQGTGTTNSSLIPQFVNQVYTNGNPPHAHNPRGGTGNGTTPPLTEGGGTVTMSIPNAGGQSWESVVFPNQAAVDSWTAWNQAFVNNNNAQAYRSQWNTELTSLGVTGVNGAKLTPPNPNSPNPFDRQ